MRGAAKGPAGNPGQRRAGGSPACGGKDSAGRPAGAGGVLPAVQGAESDMAPAAEGVECHMAGLKGLKGERPKAEALGWAEGGAPRAELGRRLLALAGAAT